MGAFFAKNITAAGRIVRGIGGIACIATAWFLATDLMVYRVALAIAGGFMLFEASRGWCLARACGIKTRL